MTYRVFIALAFAAVLIACQPVAETETPTVEPTTIASTPTSTPTDAEPFDPCAPTIHVEAWEDLDADGIQDAGEPPMPEILVVVLGGDIEPRSAPRDTTSADGLAEIPLTLSGDCALKDLSTIVGSAPQGTEITTENAVSLDGFNPQTDTVQYGVWRDPNYTPPPTWTPAPPTVFPPPVAGGLVPTLDPGIVSQQIDECPYVSPEAAESILGESLAPPDPTFPPAGVGFTPDMLNGIFMCNFATSQRRVSIYLWVADTPQQAQMHFERHRAVAGRQAIVASGLGDSAFWWPLALRLDVRYLNARLWVSFEKPGLDEADQSAELAAAALQRIDSSLGEISPAPITVPADAQTPSPSDLIDRFDIAEFGEPFSACDLLSTEEFESLLGPLTSPPVDTSGIGELVGIVDGCGVGDYGYTIFFADRPSGAYFGSLPDPSAVIVDDIGDRAWFWTREDAGATLAVVRGNVSFGFHSYRQNAAQDRALLIDLARMVIERLFERAAP